MEDRLLVEALRSRDPAAIGAVYDDYARRLYGYCWFRLRNHDAAQVAFRDTLMCAEAHIGELRSPARLGPWLIALARIECRRRSTAEQAQPDISIAHHDQDDADLRLMAWQAVAGLPELSRELLDLHYRHDLDEGDVALVTGLPSREVGELLAQARVLLEAALIAEILAHESPHACTARAAILRRRSGRIDDDLRELLVRHSLECRRCARHLPDAVSPAKVYAMLPAVVPPTSLRAQVISGFADPDLAGYRLFAATRVARFGAQGFPEQPGARRTSVYHRAADLWPRAIAALSGALITAMVLTGMCRWLGQQESGDGPIPILAGPSHSHAPRPSPAPSAPPAGARPVSATFPLGSREPVGPALVLDGPVAGPTRWHPGDGRLEVSPARLALGSSGAGSFTIDATGGDVDWSASVTAPLRLTPGAGELGPGDVQILFVRVVSDHAGSATITFQPGGARLTVSWDAPPSSPPPTTPPPSSPPPSSPPPSSPPPTSPPPTVPTSAPPVQSTSPGSAAPPSPAPSGSAG